MRRMMLMTTDERERMGRAGREHVESLFGMEGVLDTWDEMYREILSRKSAPAGSDEHASAAMTSTKRSAGMAVRVGE
jgi:hypothetical protein